jgi:hypothetical protein
MMETIITNLVATYNAAIAAKQIDLTTVYTGFNDIPDIVPTSAFPYLVFDDGGESTEASGGQSSQTHHYRVIFGFAVYEIQQEDSLTRLLALSTQIKNIMELQRNKQVDGHVWGISITPFAAQDAMKNLFRGRMVTVDFIQLEPTYFTY